MNIAPIKVPDPQAPGRKQLDYIEPAKKMVADAHFADRLMFFRFATHARTRLLFLRVCSQGLSS